MKFISGLIALVICAVGFIGSTDGCEADRCSENFFASTKHLSESSKKYCVYLAAYVKCIELQQTSCRGDLNFYGIRSSVELLVGEHQHCTQLVSTDEDRQLEADALSNLLRSDLARNLPPNDVCKYNGPSHMSNCALYGDPHLITFKTEHLTCVLNGAWPLLATKHLAIQVTNKQIDGHRVATSVSKVTVIIKSLSESCGPGVTYEASENLPKAFVDGQIWAPVGWINEISPGNHVAVHVVAINATVAIRKIDRFLQVHLSLPTSVIKLEAEDSGLCSSGCHGFQEVRIQNHHKRKTTVNEELAKSICMEYNLTDRFLDSCMFDVMTTGDKSFGKSAFLAQQDMFHLNPNFRASQKNCTNWPCEWPTSSGCNIQYNVSFLIVLVMWTLR